MSWTSRLVKKQAKILCFCNHNYLTTVLKSRLSHVKYPLVTTTDRCRYSAHLAGVGKTGCVGVMMTTPSDPTSCKGGRNSRYRSLALDTHVQQTS